MKKIYETIKQTTRKYALPAIVAGSMSMTACDFNCNEKDSFSEANKFPRSKILEISAKEYCVRNGMDLNNYDTLHIEGRDLSENIWPTSGYARESRNGYVSGNSKQIIDKRFYLYDSSRKIKIYRNIPFGTEVVVNYVFHPSKRHPGNYHKIIHFGESGTAMIPKKENSKNISPSSLNHAQETNHIINKNSLEEKIEESSEKKSFDDLSKGWKIFLLSFASISLAVGSAYGLSKRYPINIHNRFE